MTADLSHSDWLVLGALASGATHGFAISTALGKDGDLGRIWSVRRPMVYQSVSKLIGLGLISEGTSERSASGPSRTPLSLTSEGQRVLEGWLQAPVEHLREMRPLLLTKLILLQRRGGDPTPLLDAQRAHLTDFLAIAPPEGGDDVATLVDAWRRQGARGVLAFLDGQVVSY